MSLIARLMFELDCRFAEWLCTRFEAMARHR
jgi:hypothetical protein